MSTNDSTAKQPHALPPVRLSGSLVDAWSLNAVIESKVAKRRSDATSKGIDYDNLATGKFDMQSSGRLPQQLHEAVFQADLLRDKTQVQLLVSERPLPIIGRVVERMRTALHQAIIFYVNMGAQRQAAFNVEAAKSLTALVQALEDEVEHKEAALQELRTEIRELRGQVNAIERKSPGGAQEAGQ